MDRHCHVSQREQVCGLVLTEQNPTIDRGTESRSFVMKANSLCCFLSSAIKFKLVHSMWQEIY